MESLLETPNYEKQFSFEPVKVEEEKEEIVIKTIEASRLETDG